MIGLIFGLIFGPHVAARAGDLMDATVAVLGAASVGIPTLLATRATRAAIVVVADPADGKRDRALEFGQPQP
jgi:threonine dehydrogenase-like Zn-dependent dehydrogenase